MFSLVRPSAGALADLVLGQADSDLTYREVGASAGTMPPGYRHDRWEIDLGAFDEDTFRRLAAALQRWQPQRGAGFTVAPGGPVTAGLTFALVVPLPVGYMTGAGRVIDVTDQPEDSARLGGPLTRALQLRANRSYLRAMRRAAAPEPH